MAGNGRQNADEKLAVALAGGSTLRDAALSANVAERTAARRWADADFRKRVTELRAEMVKRSLGKLADGMTEAADVLRGLLRSANEGIRLGAAKALLTLGVDLRAAVEVESRLEAVEARIAAEESGGRR